MIDRYLSEKGIKVTGHYFSHKKQLNIKEINSQIKIIIDLHKTLYGGNFIGLNRIESRIGREIEGYKVQIKRLQKDYNEIIMKNNKNNLDKIIILEGKNMLSKAILVVNSICSQSYFNIIERSMNRKEICVGRVDGGNLRKKDDMLEIGSIKAVAYNLIEEDLYKFIKKLQKNTIDFEESDIINSYVHGSHLSYDSIKYLTNLCKYPRDFLKNWEKYRSNRNNKTYDEYTLEFDRALKYENKK